MKKTLSLFVLLMTTTALFAADQIRRTVIVRDGNVLLDEIDPPGKRAFVGVSMVELTPELRAFFGAPNEAGVLVSSVTENGPAAKAGVRVGDVITAINGKTVANYHDLRDAIKDNHAGDSVRIDVIRGKNRQTMMATLDEREWPEFRAFKLGNLERELPPMPKEWRGKLFGPDNDELRARIKDLEKRLLELEKRLPK
jgi:predicted metalloprotease with PDZ domain